MFDSRTARPPFLTELAALSGKSHQRVRDAIRALADEPRPPGWLKLTGREGWLGERIGMLPTEALGRLADGLRAALDLD